MGTACSKTEEEDRVVMAFIDKLLASSNISWIPDEVEKRIYCRMMGIIIAAIRESVDSVRIEFLNHTITLRMEPNNIEDRK